MRGRKIKTAVVMADSPIVCTLSGTELARQQDALLPGLARRAESIEPTFNGYQLRFAPSADLLQRIMEVINAERQCCRFLRFDLAVEADLGPITLTLSGPEGTADMLRGLLP